MTKHYKRADMIYTDYSWTAYGDDDPKVSGEPDHSLFSRHEGYEMLYMINKYMNIKGWTSVSTGQKLERFIRNSVPTDKRSQKHVREYLDNNFSL
jgi:hypothetical protein